MKLKKCPCCEAEAKIETSYGYDGRKQTKEYCVQCTKCGLRTRDYGIKSLAVNDWNKRPGK